MSDTNEGLEELELLATVESPSEVLLKQASEDSIRATELVTDSVIAVESAVAQMENERWEQTQMMLTQVLAELAEIRSQTAPQVELTSESDSLEQEQEIAEVETQVIVDQPKPTPPAPRRSKRRRVLRLGR